MPALQRSHPSPATMKVRLSTRPLCFQRSNDEISSRFRQSCARRISTTRGARAVRLVEVGPRDGLQNLKQRISTPVKVDFIERLTKTGLLEIEATSFVSPKWVPQLADGAEVMQQLPSADTHQGDDVKFSVLAPNLKGFRNASKAGANEVVVFASATQSFSKKNQNCTIDEALIHAQEVNAAARKEGIAVRGVVSCIFADPTDPSGRKTDPEEVLYVVKRLLDMGCYEVSLGDTTGVGTPSDTKRLLEVLLQNVPAAKLAGHFHDTYGQAVANIVRAYEMGIRTFDCSVAGLGGCPFAPGAKGNVATEDVVYTFEQSGVSTGVDLDRLIPVGQWISQQLGIPYGSRAGQALATRKKLAERSSAEAPAKPPRVWEVVKRTSEYKVERAGVAARVTLTRSKHGNCLTDSMLAELTQFFLDLKHDTSVFHVIIAAEGKCFCTGMDLSGTTDIADSRTGTSYHQKVVDLYEAIEHAPQTTIAVVEGPAFGGGVGLTFACDIRLVSPKARWTLSEVKLGICPAIISKYLVRELGVAFARESMLSGREINPAELHRIGAIHDISSDSSGGMEALLSSYLDKLSICAPQAARMNKELVKVAWKSPESESQANMIKQLFADMLAPGSEGEYGVSKFQKGIKGINWEEFMSQRKSVCDGQA